MNSEFKMVIFEERKILEELLNLLDKQYEMILSKDVKALSNITGEIDKVSKELAVIEIKRRDFVKEEDFKKLVNNSDDIHLKEIYEDIKVILRNLQLQKESNDTLIKQNLFFTTKMINTIKPSEGIGTYNSYGKVGR